MIDWKRDVPFPELPDSSQIDRLSNPRSRSRPAILALVLSMPAAGALTITMPALSDYCLVILAAPPYHGLRQRHQHLAEQLSHQMPVVYVEATPSAAAVYLRRVGSPQELSAHKKGLVELQKNLYWYKAPPGSPTFFNFAKANVSNMQKAVESLRPLLAAKGLNKTILWLGHPRAIEAKDALQPAFTVYDCYDAFGDFESEARVAEETKALEARALKEADLVLPSARLLYKKCAEVNPHTYLAPNGADIAHFQQQHPPPPSQKWGGVDIDALASKGKVVGYIGDIGDWFDHMLLISTAQLNPKVSFVFIGPVNKQIDSLVQLRNTHFTGRIPYAELPYYVSKFDACIIPFLNSPVTDMVNPIKMYEYFATGKPVVTTDIPEVRDYEGLLAIGNNGRAFYTKLEMELNLSGNTPQKDWVIDLRRQVAAEHSWEQRAAQVASLMEGMIAGEYPEPDPDWAARPGAKAKQWRTPPAGVAAEAPSGPHHTHAHDHGHDHDH